jgi:hypothetical protein
MERRMRLDSLYAQGGSATESEVSGELQDSRARDPRLVEEDACCGVRLTEGARMSASVTELRASAWEADGQGPLVGAIYPPRAAWMQGQMGRNWCSEPRYGFIFFFFSFLFSPFSNLDFEFESIFVGSSNSG